MKPRLLLFIFVFSALSGLTAFSAEKSPTPPSPLTPLAFLTGGLWVAQVTIPGGAPLKLEARFAWAENKQAIRFDSAWVRGDKPSPYTSGLYGWNAAKQKLVIFYTDSSGTLTEGLITQENGAFLNELTTTDRDGKIAPVKVKLTPIDANTFTNEISIMKDGAWSLLVNVRYERQPTP